MTTDTLATAPNPRDQLRLALSMAIPTLRPGDIVATASATAASRGITVAIKGPFSHAILYWGGGSAIDATPQRGVDEDFITLKLQGATVAAVFRHKTATVEQCEMAASWAALQVGKPYDYNGAARLGVLRNAPTTPLSRLALLTVMAKNMGNQTAEDHDASFYCSELIARAFEVAGAPLFDGPAHLGGPGSLLHTDRLVYMGNLQEVG